MAYAMVLGEALIDLLETADGAEPLYRAVVGGAPLNVAVGASRLGAAVEFAGSLGDDALADRIGRFLTDNGVGTRGVLRAAAPTALAVTTFAGAEPDFRFYGAPPSYGLFDVAGLDAALPAGAAVLYCGSIALLCPPVLAAARHAWAATPALRVFDPNVRPRLLTGAGDVERQRAVAAEFAATADLVKLSAADAAVLYPDKPAEAVAGLLRELGAGVVVLTLGARGALVAAGAQLCRMPAPAVRAVDATGAGDAVMAALIADLLAGGVPADPAGWRRRVEFALRVAALVCEAPGGATAMPTRAQVAARFGPA
ncbi:carbohydrate kinase family protein [Melissospora conviva]|uniref:carbohydrate kinase family protein n=1 Tax=Melissospora conviva TaxID=3388432 RepID=UPI003B7932B4